MLGSLCTGLISSSAKLCLPHSGLLRHAWLKDDQFQKNRQWAAWSVPGCYITRAPNMFSGSGIRVIRKGGNRGFKGGRGLYTVVEWPGKKRSFSKKFIKEKEENLPLERREILGILDHISLQSPLSSQSSWRMVDRPLLIHPPALVKRQKTYMELKTTIQWSLSFGTPLFKGHFHSRDTKNCSHNLCICNHYWRNTSIQGFFYYLSHGAKEKGGVGEDPGNEIDEKQKYSDLTGEITPPPRGYTALYGLYRYVPL